MRVLFLFLALLRAVAGLLFFIVLTFFANHTFGYLFGIGFKSIGGKVDGEILGAEIAIMGVIGVAYWALDVAFRKLNTNSFETALRTAMNDLKMGRDKGRTVLIEKVELGSDVLEKIEKYEPWVSSFGISKTSVSGAGPILEYGTKVKLVHKGGSIAFAASQNEIAAIMAHLMVYHEKTIFAGEAAA